MVGSANLTTPAGNRQWNDLVTTRIKSVYRYMTDVFRQYAKDKSVKHPFETATRGDFRFWIYPVGTRNPQLTQLEKVRCKGATGGTGVHGRTKVRVAVAGWFDAYGERIAKRLRHMWDHGCDVRVVTTLAGRGVNRALGATYGRGPVPQRELSWDRNYDGIPDRYLHQKSVAISGVYAGDHSASVVFTGSPNWSARAARSEEVWMRVLGRKAFTRHYMTRVDRLYSSPLSTARRTTPAQLQRAVAAHARTRGVTGEVTLPEWLELD
jgi:phosphatidylserine/phosphatidylglycerophosphate/cardiolipin synthase-like enzyme